MAIASARPRRLTIVDESSQHAGHAGSRMSAGKGGETHFNVTVTSPLFEGQNTVKRHRAIYGVRAAVAVRHHIALVCGIFVTQR